MKRLIFNLMDNVRYVMTIVVALFAVGKIWGDSLYISDTISDDSVLQHPSSSHGQRPVSVRVKKYEQRLQRRHERWESLIPNKFSLQYAGDIGMFSVGVGWDYGKRNQWETHLFLGYLPKKHTPDAYWSFTVKEVFIPWNRKINGRFSIQPLYCTLFVNSILSSEFWTREPDRYPKGYYGFSSKIRFHIGVGQKVTVNIPTEKRYLADKVSVYYGISTCDLYVRQKILSSSIPLKDILCLAVGLQYTIE